jgi:hypothetical protein
MMPSDEELSQEEIDAKVYEVTRKPETPVTGGGAAYARKPSGSSPSTRQENESLTARLARLESDITTLKKDLQAILLDLREKYLEAENPFNSPTSPGQPQARSNKTDTPGE